MAKELSELEKLYARYAKEVVFYATALTKDVAEAESLVSDAFFKLSLQRDFPREAKFWLMRVVKNQFLDSQRKRKRWRWQNLDETTLVSQETPEHILFESVENQRLYQAIDILKSPYHEAIIFFYFLEWSTTEISQYMQMTPGQIRTILYRGRKLLKEELTDE